MNKIIEKLNFGLIIFLIIMMPLCFFLANYLNSTLYFYVVLHLIIPLEVFIYIYNIVKKNSKVNKWDIFIYILLFLGIISTINAVDRQTSFWGAYLRNEGLLTFISYYLLFLNVKVFSKEQIVKILDSLFVMGVVQFIYSFLQVFVRGKYIMGFKDNFQYMASGFIGNPNMSGSFCVLILMLALVMYLIFNKKKYFVFSIIFYINLILAQSTGPFFAFIMSFFGLILVLIIKKIINWKKIFLLFSSFIVIFMFVSFTVENYCTHVFGDNIKQGSNIKGDIISTLSLFSLENSYEKEDAIMHYGSGRLNIWRNSIKIVPKYWLTGAGIDNFGYVYPVQNLKGYVDKAHNEYLQILITEGVFALIAYILFLLSLFIDGLKSKESLSLVLIIGIVGYALQAFMNISVPLVAPFYFIVCGMLASTVQTREE